MSNGDQRRRFHPPMPRGAPSDVDKKARDEDHFPTAAERFRVAMIPQKVRLKAVFPSI